MRSITVTELEKRLASERDAVLIDVREPSEHKSGAIPGAKNIPAERMDEAVATLKDHSTIYIACNSGGRSSKTCAALESYGLPVVNVGGGFSAWQAAGFPIHKENNTLPMMRQVLLTVGILILIGVILSGVVHPYWIGLSAFIGAGLTFAGATGWCGMTKVLALMPWNR